jgi:hypothetical protein
MEDVRLERSPIFPFPIRPLHLSFYWKSLVGSERIGETSDPVRSSAYFPEWKLAALKQLHWSALYLLARSCQTSKMRRTNGKTKQKSSLI